MKTYKILGNGLYQRSILNSVLIAALFLAVTLSPQAYSHGQGTDQPAAVVAATAEQKNRAKELTLQLGKLIAEYKSAGTASSSELANQLTALAEERRQILGELIENDPAEVLRQALPDDVLDQMPAKAQAFLEQHRVMEGELQLLHVDYKDQSQSHYVYLLSTDTGEHYSLHFAKQGPDIQSGSRVRVNGVAFYGIKARDAGETDGAVVLDDGTTSLEILAAGGSGSTTTATTTSSAVLPNTFGEQRTLVLLVNFQDVPGNNPWTVEQARNLVFGTVSDFIRENSYGQTWLNGGAYGWYTLPLNSTVCDSTQIASKADSAATAAGVDLSLYSRRVYIFPYISSCGWSGAGTVGGALSQAWINGKFELKTIGHELGHNFGLQHSHALECGTTTLGTIGINCQNFDYGDHFDIMGNYRAGHLNAFQKAQLGWLGYGSSPSITTVETSGTYSLEPYEPGGNGAKALKVLKGIDPVTGAQSWYYLEYRQAFSADSFLTGNNNILNGIVFHSGTDSDRNSGFLLDMTPASSTSGYDDWEDTALTVGQGFTDPDSGVTITTVSADGAGTSVNVDFGAQSCVRASPILSLSTSQASGVAPGTPVSYAVTVTNRDNSACGPVQFALAASVPTGWSAAFASPTLSVAVGATASTTLTVTSSGSAAAGSYNISATATDSTNSAYSASASAIYSVVVPSLSTSVVTDKAVYQKGDTVTITASATSGGKPVANASVTFTVTKPNGSTVNQSATTNSNGQAVYKMRLSRQKDPAGTYQVRDNVTSSGQTASGLASFGVN